MILHCVKQLIMIIFKNFIHTFILCNQQSILVIWFPILGCHCITNNFFLTEIFVMNEIKRLMSLMFFRPFSTCYRLLFVMFWDFLYICWFLVSSGIVHENPRILSDGESEEISGTSSEDFVSPVKLRSRPRRTNDVRIVRPSPLSLPPVINSSKVTMVFILV